MADPIRSHLRSAFAGELHQVDAAARRIHLLAPQDVRGTNRQAEAAVNAFFNDFIRRRMMSVEGTAGNSYRGRIGHQIPPTKRPGFNVFAGSSCFFTAFINSSASPALPQASMCAIPA